ncbi:MAG: hypothetical protein O2958_11835 [Gemmatimonadetes bacterium]|nr:hypothetical protein [Gemmatimonadota bacterium]MDA1103908.1 hypothetical protein [Gemmatimonadota bacterium]
MRGLEGDQGRRAFLKRLAILGAGGSAMSLAACSDRNEAERLAAAQPTIAPMSRPLLLPWSADVIRIASAPAELPGAYVSMATMKVFVDRAFRDRASWLLNAHISVSTALWRIPLLGDPLNQPVTPGDELREFEEISIREWDPNAPTALHDIRIRRGARATRGVHFACVPRSTSGTDVENGAWYSAGPWTMDVCDGRPGDSTREDFRLVGAGLRYRTRECDDGGERVQYVTWACNPT